LAFSIIGCLKGKSELFRLRFALFTTVCSADFPLFLSSSTRSNSILGQKWGKGEKRNWMLMLLYLGVISRENMQIEGFWYYLFLGTFEASTIHYAVAKIFGPVLFGRGWCGYACWTAMALDFLPYKRPQKPRREKLGVLRYVMFALSLALVTGLFLMKVAHLEQIMF